MKPQIDDVESAMHEQEFMEGATGDTHDLEEQALEMQQQILDKLGLSLSQRRSTCINARETCGIETIWKEDVEHYEGIDESNRGTANAWRSKPLGQKGAGGDEASGSTVFFNITRPYCDLASSRTSDMLLPTDDRGWAIDPTPIPDMVTIAGGEMPPRIMKQIKEAHPDDPEAQQGVISEAVEQEKELMAEAKETAERAEKRIADWHEACQYNANMRQVIEDCSKMGTGIMKGPVPMLKQHYAYINGELINQEEVEPVSYRVDPFNCYPDDACGEDIHNGSQHWERDDISKGKLRDLIEQPGYLADQIKACLQEGPHQATKSFDAAQAPNGLMVGLRERDSKNLFEIWYFYGVIEKDDAEAAGCECGEDVEDQQVHAEVVMVNNRVIRAQLNTLEDGSLPYDYVPWQRRLGVPWGMGVSRQVREPQRVINGAGRNLMDNAGLAGGPMWIYNAGMVTPLDGVAELRPRKGWQVGEDAEDGYDVSKAFHFIQMDMMQNDLQGIIQLGMSMAEHISGLPSLLQGQQQEDKNETLGSRQMRRNDGSSTLRRFARQYDDYCTTPHLRRYYDFILQYGEDNEKGDFTITARGSSALVERDLQNQTITDMGNIVSDPSYGLDKKKWAIEYLKSQRLDPKAFEFDDEEWEKVLTQLSAPPPDSSVEVANMRYEFEQGKLAAVTEKEVYMQQLELSQKDKDRQLKLIIAEMENILTTQVTAGKISGDKDKNIDTIKSRLAETLITLKAQMSMSADGSAPEVAEPVIEPEGRAPDGQAFQK